MQATIPLIAPTGGVTGAKYACTLIFGRTVCKNKNAKI